MGANFALAEPHRYPDTTSEWSFPEHDLIEWQAESTANELLVTLRYAGPLVLTDGNDGPWSSTAISGSG